MRRLYVVPRSLMFGSIQTGTRPGPDGEPQPVMTETNRLMHPIIGWHALDLPGDLLLMSTSFDHNERYEDIFHAHPEVAILPNPTLDGNKPLKTHIGAAGYRFTQAHLDAITSHAPLGALESDTVLDLFRKAEQVHPLVRLRNVL